MVSCITQSLLELKLVNGSGEIPAGRTGGVMMRKAEVRLQMCFQGSPLFEQQCAHLDYTCICICFVLLIFTL